jgi:hypothetical protein
MALTLLARMHGPQIAQGVQLAIEYDPSRPSAPAHPRKPLPRSWSSSGGDSTHSQRPRRERSADEVRFVTTNGGLCSPISRTNHGQTIKKA